MPQTPPARTVRVRAGWRISASVDIFAEDADGFDARVEIEWIVTFVTRRLIHPGLLPSKLAELQAVLERNHPTVDPRRIRWTVRPWYADRLNTFYLPMIASRR